MSSRASGPALSAGTAACVLSSLSAALLLSAAWAPVHAQDAPGGGTVLPPVQIEPPRERPRAGRSQPSRSPARATGPARPARSRVATRAPSARAVRTPVLAAEAAPGSRVPGSAGSAFLGAAATPIERPVGQVSTSVDRGNVIDNRLATNVADILRNSPGVTVRPGNGGRDFIVSIRGSNARSTGTARNMVVLEDGFPVTQADGASRFDITDPRAYGRVDVFRGPQSPLFGNYASGGAINFQTRRGAEVGGIEYGVDVGSFGFLNNYTTVGGASGAFEYSLTASDTRSNGFTDHSAYNTQTINFLGTWAPTPDNRFTLKIINNFLDADIAARVSLNQYLINPLQRGCGLTAIAAPGCGTSNFFLNGRDGTAVPQTASDGNFGRIDRRTIIGGRYEHDFDANTTWRTQLVWDDRFINQPVNNLTFPGDFAGYNFLTDLTRRDTLFGLPTVGYVALGYSGLVSDSHTYNRTPFPARRGEQTADLQAFQDNFGGRARIEVQLSDTWTGAAGIGVESTTIKGRNLAYTFPAAGGYRVTRADFDRSFLNVAPELSLTYRPSDEWRFLGRVATGYSTPLAASLFVTSAGQPGNNTTLQTQENLGFDLGAYWTPMPGLELGVTGFYEVFRNELITQSPGAGLLNYTFNAPASEHRGVEVGARWKSPTGWNATLAYTFNDQIYTKYSEQLSAGTRSARFDRAGNHIPGVPSDQLLFRIGYDQPTGPLAGLGAFVETVYQSDFYIDNANLLKIPDYAIVNANIHYDTALQNGLARRLNVYFEVRNVFDATYVASAQNIANSISAATGLQNGANVLAATSGSIYAGAPRSFVGGVRLSF